MILRNKYIYVILYRYADNSDVNKSSDENASSKQQIERTPLPISFDDAHREDGNQLANKDIQQYQNGDFVDPSLPKSVSEQQFQSYSNIRMHD